jgi:hypothetical protein
MAYKGRPRFLRRPGAPWPRQVHPGRVEVGLTSRSRAREGTPRPDPSRRCRERHTPVRLRSGSRAGLRAVTRVREDERSIGVAVAAPILRSRSSLLDSPRGRVTFPASPDASRLPWRIRSLGVTLLRRDIRTPHIPGQRPSHLRAPARGGPDPSRAPARPGSVPWAPARPAASLPCLGASRSPRPAPRGGPRRRRRSRVGWWRGGGRRWPSSGGGPGNR